MTCSQMPWSISQEKSKKTEKSKTSSGVCDSKYVKLLLRHSLLAQITTQLWETRRRLDLEDAM